LIDSITKSLGTKDGSTIGQSINTVREKTEKIKEWLNDESTGITSIMNQSPNAIKNALGGDLAKANKDTKDEVSRLNDTLSVYTQQETNEKKT
jgi:hypothetical protein